MLGKLRFKASLFAGVLDNGQDTIFASENKFNEMMEDLQSTVEDTGNSDAQPITPDEVEPSADTSQPVDDELGDEPVVQQESGDKASERPQDDGEAEVSPKQESSEESLSGAIPTSKEKGTPKEKDALNTRDSGIQPRPHYRSPRSPQELVADGVSFFTGLSKTLESPEATREFVDSLVEVDKETGETNLRIPVPDKESVVQVLGALAKLVTQFGK